MKWLLVVSALGFACNKPAATTPSGEPDHVVVLAHHKPAKPTDPVQVHFDRFRVVKASFDPKTIEGGTARVEIDLASLHSGSGERDDDLKSANFIDVANVKRRHDKTFSADATVALRGATKTYPVTFDVIEQADDHIRIKGQQEFSRLDFTVGTDPASDPRQQVDTGLTIEMVLTIANS